MVLLCLLMSIYGIIPPHPQLTNTKLGLEEQRDLISRKHDEIKKRRAVLKEIEVCSKQPIRARCLGHVTGYQPIRVQGAEGSDN